MHQLKIIKILDLKNLGQLKIQIKMNFGIIKSP